MNKLSGADGGYSHLIAANEKYQADLKAGKVQSIEQVRSMMQTAVTLDQQAIAHKAATKAIDEEAKAWAENDAAMKKIMSSYERVYEEIAAGNAALQLEHDTLGMTANAIAAATSPRCNCRRRKRRATRG